MISIRKIESNGKKINDINDWKVNAHPKKSMQWVPNHSAMEFAFFILNVEKNELQSIKNPDVFEKAIKEFTNCDDFDFYAEYETKLVTDDYDFYIKNGRQHDGLMVGNDIVIGIEAKATESLDTYLGDKPIYDCLPSHIKRYHDMTKAITGRSALDCEKIRYQLLSGTAGTIIEAHNRNMKKALFLLITLKTCLVKDQMIDRNERDIRDFLSLLKKDKDGSYQTPLSDELGIKLYVKHIVIDVFKSHNK